MKQYFVVTAAFLLSICRLYAAVESGLDNHPHMPALFAEFQKARQTSQILDNIPERDLEQEKAYRKAGRELLQRMGDVINCGFDFEKIRRESSTLSPEDRALMERRMQVLCSIIGIDPPLKLAFFTA